MSALPEVLRATGESTSASDSRGLLLSRAAHELFFAVVGPVGAGSSHVARNLVRCLKEAKLAGMPFTCEDPLKASDVIRASYGATDLAEVEKLSPLKRKEAFQEKGDALRLHDHAAIAASLIRRIAEARARAQNSVFNGNAPVAPDGRPRAYVVDSLKHPAEAKLLRALYGDAFVLIGVVCSPPTRRRRLADTLFTGRERDLTENQVALDEFMNRDADDLGHKNGQHVTDTFYQADFFIDNTPDTKKPSTGDMRDAADDRIIGELTRLLSIILHDRIQRPSIDEAAMNAAYSAQLQSSCLSRQVGAALVDENGNIVATGTNEVPKAGGGVYGEDLEQGGVENRCAFCENPGRGPFCSNNAQQNELIEDVLKALLGKDISKEDLDAKLIIVRNTQLGGLLEFSRSVHAEMDALLSAGRSGVSTIGSRLFVTTYPCHYCARHIVSAGVYEVQYIEPYPKSRAIELHGDAIENVPEDWCAPIRRVAVGRREKTEGANGVHASIENQATIEVGKSPSKNGKVLFRPFVGVAPRLYSRVFKKDREYKNKITGALSIEAAEWGYPWSQHQISYAELELQIIKQVESNG